MSLPDWVRGARRPSMLVTWYQNGMTTPEDLTGATLSGYIQDGTTTTAITGDLAVTDGESGVFRWDFSEADVDHVGKLRVQFVATFGSGQTPAKTFVTEWLVRSSLGAS